MDQGEHWYQGELSSVDEATYAFTASDKAIIFVRRLVTHFCQPIILKSRSFSTLTFVKLSRGDPMHFYEPCRCSGFNDRRRVSLKFPIWPAGVRYPVFLRAIFFNDNIRHE